MTVAAVAPLRRVFSRKIGDCGWWLSSCARRAVAPTIARPVDPIRGRRSPDRHAAVGPERVAWRGCMSPRCARQPSRLALCAACGRVRQGALATCGRTRLRAGGGSRCAWGRGALHEEHHPSRRVGKRDRRRCGRCHGVSGPHAATRPQAVVLVTAAIGRRRLRRRCWQVPRCTRHCSTAKVRRCPK